MQGWQDELNAQNQFGRSQMDNTIESGISNRPFNQHGYQGGYQGQQGGYQKPRQLGGGMNRQPNYGHNNFRENGYEGENKRPTGHLAFLKSLQRSGATVRLLTIHDEQVIGSVKDCDETTISLRVPCATESNPDAYQNRVFFKQNLVEFAPVIEGVTFS